MTCHALNCPNPALPGMPQCYEHWMMLPAKVREAKPWVRPVKHFRSVCDFAQVGKSASSPEQENEQMELFA